MYGFYQVLALFLVDMVSLKMKMAINFPALLSQQRKFDKNESLRLVFTSDGVVVGVIIRRVG